MLSFLTVNVDIELEILVVTSTMLDMFVGTFVKGVGFVGLGFVTPTVELTVDDNGLVLSVVVVMPMYSGLVVFVVVLVLILVGFNFVVVDDDGLAVVDLLTVVVVAVVDLAVVVLIVGDFVIVVFEVVFGVVVFIVDTLSGLFVVIVVVF